MLYIGAGHGDDSVAHHIACWVPKATNTHSEYFLLQPRLHEGASLLRYTPQYLARPFV